jgi:hypothetical protein
MAQSHIHSICMHAGPIPWGMTPKEQLEPLNPIEENVVSLYRVHRLLYVMKPVTATFSSRFGRQYCHRAHIIALPNAGSEKVRDCILQPTVALADSIHVVFLVLVESDDEDTIRKAIQKMIKRSPALYIRGKLVAKWAMHLSRVSKTYQQHIIYCTACQYE